MKFAFSHVLTVSGNEAGSGYSQIASEPKRASASSDCCMVLSAGSYKKISLEISETRQWAGNCEIAEPVPRHENGSVPFQAKANLYYSSQDTSPHVPGLPRVTTKISRSAKFSNVWLSKTPAAGKNLPEQAP